MKIDSFKFALDLGKTTKVVANIPFSKALVASLGMNGLIVVLYLVFVNYLPPVVPLYYGAADGEAQLANRSAIIIPALTSLTITIINLILTKTVIKNDFAKKVLILGAIGTTVLTTITTLKIIMLVGSF